MLARQTVVVAAKAHKLQAIDAVYIDYRDTEGLRRQSEEGAGWGFTGKQVNFDMNQSGLIITMLCWRYYPQ